MINIDITTKSNKWDDQEKFVEKICKKIILLTELEKFLKKNIQIGVSVSLVLDQEMKKINFEFRGKNKPTNVLSFPANDWSEIKKNPRQIKDFLFLGDIVIAFETIKKESLVQKKPFENHLTHLILHSILHLIGHDHEKNEMAKIMENLEIKILKKLKIVNPYKN